MAVLILDATAACSMLEASQGAHPASEAGLAELLREEVSARGTCQRSSLLHRVLARMDGVVPLESRIVESTCDALVQEGDFLAAPGGEIAATPIRVVAVSATSVRVFTSLPSTRLARLLDLAISTDGFRRSLAPAPHLTERVRALQGAVLTPQQWAGLTRAPRANAAFLDELTERLSWTPTHSWTEDRHGPLDWQGLVAEEAEAVWRRPPARARLWRARHPVRRFVNAWTAGEPPSVARYVELNSDEALRTRFAEAAGLGAPARVRVGRLESETLLEVPGWLPRAEYRWLSLLARPAGDGVGTRRWAITPGEAAGVLLNLRECLGVEVDEAP